jgi:hypothetical protein
MISHCTIDVAEAERSHSSTRGLQFGMHGLIGIRTQVVRVLMLCGFSKRLFRRERRELSDDGKKR